MWTPDNEQQNLSNYYYNSSTVGDTVGDTRVSNQSGWHYTETCTVANASKGGGTWILTEAKKTISLSDSNMAEGAGSYVDLLTSKSGLGRVIIGDAQEYVYFIFKVDGTVNLLDYSANVVTSSINDKLVIRDAGTNVRIVNELGSTLMATIVINYNA